ncbi:MAG TPA: 4Fe-4S binding protein, partial [Granulicella sp.]|nr:4Fe-4S binding protein [Granulicella sp.]
SITGIDLDTFVPRPYVAGRSSHGGYCGPAVKPIALNMVEQVMNDPESALPMSGIGGIANWNDAAEFLLLGCGTVQVCTAAMHYGFRIVEDMIDGLTNWMHEKGFSSIEEFRGLSLGKVTDWKHLDLNYKIVAQIDAATCIGCALCYTACWDGAHQCIHLDRVSGPVDGPVEVHATPAAIEAASRSRIAVTPIPKLDPAPVAASGPFATPLERIPRVDQTECVGCNLCSLVCPVDECITMVEVNTGLAPESWDERSRMSVEGSAC